MSNWERRLTKELPRPIAKMNYFKFAMLFFLMGFMAGEWLYLLFYKFEDLKWVVAWLVQILTRLTVGLEQFFEPFLYG